MSDHSKNQVIIMAVGVGAIGTILAYLGYSIFSSGNLNNVAIDITGTTDTVNDSVNNTNDAVNDIVNDAVNYIVNDNDIKKVKKKGSVFFDFWKTEEVKSDIKEEVKSDIKEEVKSDIKEELKSDIKEELKSDIKEEYKSIMHKEPYHY